MERGDYDEFSTIMQEMASMYRGVMFNDFFVSGYWRVLKHYSMGAIRQAVLQLLGDELRKDGMPTAAEIKAIARRHEGRTREETCIPCPAYGCTEQVPWPPKVDGESSMWCSFHKPIHGDPVTRAEKIAIAANLTPKGRAFLRSAVGRLMADIPVTEEELQYTDPDDKPSYNSIPDGPKDRWVAEVYGATPEDVRKAQANAASRTLEHV